MRFMFSHHRKKCRNPECDNQVLGHRCSGYCSIECLKQSLKLNEEKLKKENFGKYVEINYAHIKNYYNISWREIKY